MVNVHDLQKMAMKKIRSSSCAIIAIILVLAFTAMPKSYFNHEISIATLTTTTVEVPDEIILTEAPSRKADLRVDIVEELSSVALFNLTSATFSAASKDADIGLQQSLLSLGFTKRPGNSGSAITIINSVRQFDAVRLTDNTTWINHIKSQCIWGSQTDFHDCLNQYAKSKLCDVHSLRISFSQYSVGVKSDCLQIFKIAKNRNFDLQLISNDGLEMAVNDIHRALGMEPEDTIEQFCSNNLGSTNAIIVKPKELEKEKRIVLPILVASIKYLVILGDVTNIADEDASEIKRIASIVGAAIQRSFLREYRYETKNFQMINLELLRVGEAWKINSVKPNQRMSRRWSLFLAKLIHLKYWNVAEDSVKTQASSTHASADAIRVLFNGLTEDIASIVKECSLDDQINEYISPIITRRAIPKCRNDEIALGSHVSCSDLGWTEIPATNRRRAASQLLKFHRYSPIRQVCGASQIHPPQALSRAKALGFHSPYDECSDFVSWTQADQFCKRAGTRLCTYEELTSAQMVSGTGCDGDRSRIWTQTVCSLNPLSYLTGPGQPQTSPQLFPPKCVPADELYPPAKARCCADDDAPRCVAKTHPSVWQPDIANIYLPPSDCESSSLVGSDLTCAELRFRQSDPKLNLANSTGHRVCGRAIEMDEISVESSLAIDEANLEIANSRGRYLKLDFSSSQSLCQRRGARLCTSNEIEIGIVSWTDNDWRVKRLFFWSSEDCGDGKMRIVSPGAESKCIDRKQSNIFVVCCGDEFGPSCSSGR